jgi:transcriptional repressor NrdR
MKCPYCAYEQDKVVDSRSSKEGRAVRRRRECLKCEKRFTTYEYIEIAPLTIIKNDQRREPFDRQKLLSGIEMSCKKRPISKKQVEAIVDRISDNLERLSKLEVPSSDLGKMVMSELYKLDEVAYVRFASVYRQFKDKDAFVSEIVGMEAKPEDEAVERTS